MGIAGPPDKALPCPSHSALDSRLTLLAKISTLHRRRDILAKLTRLRPLVDGVPMLMIFMDVAEKNGR